jgi:hypothetical protein
MRDSADKSRKGPKDLDEQIRDPECRQDTDTATSIEDEGSKDSWTSRAPKVF